MNLRYLIDNEKEISYFHNDEKTFQFNSSSKNISKVELQSELLKSFLQIYDISLYLSIGGYIIFHVVNPIWSIIGYIDVNQLKGMIRHQRIQDIFRN